MGRTICAAVAADPDLVFVAGVDPGGAGESIAGITVDEHLHAFADAQCEVVVDFTVAHAARQTLPWLGMHGIHAVVGTTGFTTDDYDLFESTFGAADGPNCVIAPNFAISAVLMMRFAEMAAPWFDTAEIIELHHDRKIDAPSGTAVKTAERMAAARDRDFDPDPTEHEVYPGRAGRGARRDPCPLRSHARDGRPPGGDPRGDRPDPDDPSGQLRPRQFHAGRAARLQAHRVHRRSHPLPRPVPDVTGFTCRSSA